MQRIGRAGHTICAASRGVIVPKYRGDLVACAAVTRAMHEARIESSRYPRNPLDVLAQQIVAAAAEREWGVDELYALARRAENFAELGRESFEAVLGMLAGQYPADEFADLKPRVIWDRVTGRVHSRRDARTVAILSGGTIPDRGLFGVFLVDGGEGDSRGPGGDSIDCPPCATAVSWNCCTCSGELHLKPIVPPFAGVAGSSLIGSLTPKLLPSWR